MLISPVDSQITNLNPSCGLFLHIPIPNFPGFKYDFVSFDNIRIPTKRSFPFSFDSEAGRDADILQSCNGLFLCCNDKSYYVCNPSNNLYRMLPQQHNPNNKPIDIPGVGGIIMAFDPTKSPHYEVIYAGVVHDDELGHSIQIQTFSSESMSKCWTHESTHSSSRKYSTDAKVYLPYKEEANDHESSTSCNHDKKTPHQRLQREDKLWHQLSIYEMRTGCSEWSVKYHVNLNDIMMPFPEHWSIGLCAWCVVLGYREEDSFIVTELYNKVVRYNIMLKTVHTLIDLGSVSPSESFPFIASFASCDAI
nr:hypothetical protein [Tanacetum cinerariifolium]